MRTSLTNYPILKERVRKEGGGERGKERVGEREQGKEGGRGEEE